MTPINFERLRLVEQLRARRAASIAGGSELAILMQAAQERAAAEQLARDQREAARLRKLLDLDAVEAAPPRKRRNRGKSISTLIGQARRAGERGPVRIEQVKADGSRTIITSSSEAAVEEMTVRDAERLWQERIGKHAD
jgi:hypothetical protein